MRVLLAIETSKSSERALSAIIHQMDPADAEVSVLHVLPSHSSMQVLKEAKEHAAHIQNRLVQAGFAAQAAVAEGDAEDAVVDHATRWKADLIVVGAYERTGLNRFLKKSFADAIARRGPCSVQVVRTPATPTAHSKILLAIDDSESTEAALRQLIAQSQPQETEVRVLQMIEPMPLIADGQVWRSDAELSTARQEQYRNAERLARRTADTLRDAGFRVSTVIEKGTSKRALMESAKQWQAGLIMLGSGDVAVQAPCSVQITRA